MAGMAVLSIEVLCAVYLGRIMNYELGIGYQQMSCSAYGILRTLHAVESRMVQPTGVEVECTNLEDFIIFINRSRFFSYFLVNLYYVNIYS